MILGCATLVAAPQIASAESPLRTLDSNVTDRVGALDERRSDVLDAVGALYEQHRLDLYVVYVDDFAGMPADRWADDTARLTALGTSDILLAVATTDGQYAMSVDPNYPISDADLRKVESVAIEPPLNHNDWAGIAVGAADGLAAVRSQQPIPAPAITPGDPDPGAAEGGENAWLWIIVGVIAVAVAGVAWLAFRRVRTSSSHVDHMSKNQMDQ